MARKNSIKDCKRGREARNLASRLAQQDEDIEYGNGGNHPFVKTRRGKMPIPFGTWGKGLRSSVIKQWLRLGLPVILLVVLGVARYLLENGYIA